MTDLFDSQDYAGEIIRLPICQLANKQKPDEAGMIITLDNAKNAGFDPKKSKIWRTHHHYFNKESTDCYISSTPRMMVFRQGPLILRERNSNKYLGNFNKDKYNKATMYTARSFLLFMVDENNNLLNSTPIKLTTKGSFSYSFGNAYQSWCKDISDAYIKTKNPANKKQRGERFTGLGVFQIELVPALKGDKEQSWVCDVASYVKPDEKNWESMFLGYDDKVRAIIEGAYQDTEGYFDYSGSQEQDDAHSEADSQDKVWNTFFEYLEKAANEVEVEKTRKWMISKVGELEQVNDNCSKRLLVLQESSGGAPAYEDIPFARFHDYYF